jgi:hypothetical protein
VSDMATIDGGRVVTEVWARVEGRLEVEDEDYRRRR